MIKGLAALAVLFVCGCDLYFGGGDDVQCEGDYDSDGITAPAYELRDPNTGLCQPFGGGGCDWVDPCHPCLGTGGAESGGAAAQPDWGMCYGHCSALDESSCRATSGCFAAYLDDPAADGNRSFWGCWETAPSGPLPGTCDGLDAQSCSRHDNCIAIYAGYPNIDTPGGTTKFAQCAPEPTNEYYCLADEECGPNAHCDTTECHYKPCPDCGPNCGICAEATVCYGVCVPDNDAGECYGPVTCTAPAPACPMGTTPGVKNGCYTGYCIPTSQCSPNDPGECFGQVLCDALPPQCPSGTVAGVKNGCWSGFCIPQSACPPAPCNTLTSEAACVARMDCMPVYEGDQCTCYPDGCECQILTYDRCEPL